MDWKLAGILVVLGILAFVAAPRTQPVVTSPPPSTFSAAKSANEDALAAALLQKQDNTQGASKLAQTPTSLPPREGTVTIWHDDDPAVASSSTDNYAAAMVAVRLLRESLRDPDSLVLENVFARRPAYAICIRYRAKNGFGGYNREFVAFHDLQLTKSAAIWNKHCAGSGFYDIPTFGL